MKLNLTKNIEIGIDLSVIGFGIGYSKDSKQHMLGIYLLIFYMQLVIPKVNRRLTKFIITDYDTVFVNDRIYRVIPDKDYNPTRLYVRTQGITEILRDMFSLIKDSQGYTAILKYNDRHGRSWIKPVFYSHNEFYYFKPDQIIKGYISGDNIIAISVVE